MNRSAARGLRNVRAVRVRIEFWRGRDKFAVAQPSPQMVTRIHTAADILREAGVSEKKPITPARALRFRGIGPKTLPYLEELGLVRLDD
ncbi:MAG: hypothetical protein ACREH8_23085 [Opitutaceae bacterium]